MVLSNLAPKVSAKMPLAETCFGALKAEKRVEMGEKGSEHMGHMTLTHLYEIVVIDVFVVFK